VTKTLRLAVVTMAGVLVGTGTAMAEEPETTFSHPANPAPAQGAPVSNAFNLAVPMIDRPDAHPSYGPAPAAGPVDQVQQMDQMMEMDHSQHQMPGMDHSQHQMPGMNHDTQTENSQ
jgi:hypothetical protein